MTQSQKWLRSRSTEKKWQSVYRICFTSMLVWTLLMSITYAQMSHPFKVEKLNWSGLDWTKNVEANLIVYGK